VDREPYYYSLNWMGPVSKSWCEEHGYNWSMGRIDVSLPDDPYGIEYFVPAMETEDWVKFSTFLRDLDTNVMSLILYSKEELFSMFETIHGKIRWRHSQSPDNGTQLLETRFMSR